MKTAFVLVALFITQTTVALVSIAQTTPPPAEVAARQRRDALQYCRDHVFFPEKILISCGTMPPATQIMTDHADSLTIVTTVKNLCDRVADVRSGKRKSVFEGLDLQRRPAWKN